MYFLRNLFCLFLMIFHFNIYASNHSLHAHDHGIVNLSIAVDNKTIDFDLDSPADSIIGFESRPSNKEEVAQFNKVYDLWMNNFFELIQLEKSLGCKKVNSRFEQILEKKEIHAKNSKESGTHSEVEATAQIVCEKAVSGQKMVLALKKHFKKIKKIHLEIVSENSKKMTITKDLEEVKF